ncbi:MAG: ATP-binding protein [Anaerolineae bacterium]|nr:ATP-binding protein [Anaerolineae bacterium]
MSTSVTATKPKSKPRAVSAAVPFADSLEHLLAGLAYIDLHIRWAVARARLIGLNPDDEFRGLYISDDQIDSLLGYELGHSLWSSVNGKTADGAETGLEQWPLIIAEVYQEWQSRTEATRKAGVPMLLDDLGRQFELTSIELDALLIALAPEVDPRYERLYAYLQDDVTRKRPSVDLVLNLLTHSFTDKLRARRLFTDDGRLIQSRLLVRFSDHSATEPSLLVQYVRPAGRVVEHLLGHSGLDSGLEKAVSLVDTREWQPSPRLDGDWLAQLVRVAQERNPLFAFYGGYGAGKRDAAASIAHTLALPLISADMAALSADNQLDEGMTLLLRDGRLNQALLYLYNWDTLLKEGRPPHHILTQLLAYPQVVIMAGATIWQPLGENRRRSILPVSFTNPDYDGRIRIWQHYLGNSGLSLSDIANNFRFSPGQIEDAIATARDLASWRNEPMTEADLFLASRAHSNQNLGNLATKIKPRYTWDDIILPYDTLNQLREMVNQVRQKPIVYGRWGFDRKLALGKGLHSLFAGESGTGKTMAADIMAGELGLDLYKIDLSSLVSKYIGETEKNLDRIFTEAATSNAILFFDEADAIFGKRSEVKDSHDRYANIEISYLLQRMEAYDGVVILATNLRANMDDAFTRRLHFAIEFPYPEVVDRERIWRVNFPGETPTAPDVDWHELARRFRLAGGNIRNVILAAAFLAAEHDEAVGMRHLLHATRREYQKMGRLIDERLFTWPPPQREEETNYPY